MLFSRTSRNLKACFTGCRWLLSSRHLNHQFLFSHCYQSPPVRSTDKVMRSLIFPKGLPTLDNNTRHQIHHQTSSIVDEDQLDPFSLVADELSLVANRLRAMVVAEVPKLASAAEYFFKMGVEGKRFRPTVRIIFYHIHMHILDGGTTIEFMFRKF